MAAVYEFDPIADPRWNALVHRHPRGGVFHSPQWLAALKAAYGYEPFAVTSSPSDSPEMGDGIVFCRIKSWLTGSRLVSLPFSDHCEPLVDGQDQLNSLLAYVEQVSSAQKLKYVEVRPVFSQPEPAGFSAGESFHFHRLDLTNSPEALFRSFHKDCIQRKVRRAERELLDYEEGNSEEFLQKFYKLLLLTRRRHQLPPQPISWFRSLIANLGDILKIRIAAKDGRPVASILTLSYKKIVVYKYGCSDASANNMGGTPFLFWKTIQEAKEQGMVELDMGRSDSDNPGLIAFKEHWGAQPSTLVYWRYPKPAAQRHSSWKTRLARQLVSAVPDSSLVAAGKLLYRHIG
ncbi:MAG TPA: GNAT family N-acetyltransferase [Terriglobales bacterium]|nr:GNAT family N-acetyltransferase [Terriglobales bacterium]